MRCQCGELKFKPRIPKEWEEYSFRIKYQDTLLEVKVSKEGAEFALIEGDEIPFIVAGEKIHLTAEKKTYTCALA